jgi:uncharacterized protein YkwD
MADSRAEPTSVSWSILLASVIGCVLALSPGAYTTAAEKSVRNTRKTARQSGHNYHFNRMERCFMHKINDRRALKGLRRLAWDKQIGYVARRHAAAMARRALVLHDPRLANEVTHWRALGQNTGGGGRCAVLFRSFWASPGHRSNILGRWRYIGVGARWRRGSLYVQQVFEYRSNPGNVYGFP